MADLLAVLWSRVSLVCAGKSLLEVLLALLGHNLASIRGTCSSNRRAVWVSRLLLDELVRLVGLIHVVEHGLSLAVDQVGT